MDFRKRRRLIFKLFDLCSIVTRIIIIFSCFLFLLFISYKFRVIPSSIGPTRIIPSFSITNSILTIPTSTRFTFPELRIQSQLLLPDSIIILVELELAQFIHEIDCVYPNNLLRPILFDGYDKFRWIFRCPLSPANNSSPVELRWRNGDVLISGSNSEVPMWDRVVYEAVVDSGTVVVFVKGLNLRRDKEFDPKLLRCRFEFGINITIRSIAISAAQEIVRCPLPNEVNQESKKKVKVKVAVERQISGQRIPSIAQLYSEDHQATKNYMYNLCGCTMVWNKAHAIREWVTYHARLDVHRWFIYDNNSEDGLQSEIKNLDLEGFNVTRKSWPWIKSQEAGFSHCVLRAKKECKWVAFFDVDEFYYFPTSRNGWNTLGSLVEEYSNNNSNLGEIRTKCHSFGPSGLFSRPLRGVTIGYTCRLKSVERHKSIIKLEAIDDTLANVVHHFKLKKGFISKNVHESRVLINHYKYQVWDDFKSKFSRRVSTYVADWRDDQNEGSKDRAPGLGKEAIKPRDWEQWFCEVWDTGLRDFVMANLIDRESGLLPWENSVSL